MFIVCFRSNVPPNPEILVSYENVYRGVCNSVTVLIIEEYVCNVDKYYT